MTKKFNVHVRLSAVISVEAATKEEAMRLIQEEYYENRQEELLEAAREDFSLNGLDSVAIIDVVEGE